MYDQRLYLFTSLLTEIMNRLTSTCKANHTLFQDLSGPRTAIYFLMEAFVISIKQAISANLEVRHRNNKRKLFLKEDNYFCACKQLVFATKNPPNSKRYHLNCTQTTLTYFALVSVKYFKRQFNVSFA